MKVSELIELLKDIPQDLEIRYKDSYFGELSFATVNQEFEAEWDAHNREWKLIPIVLLDADL